MIGIHFDQVLIKLVKFYIFNLLWNEKKKQNSLLNFFVDASSKLSTSYRRRKKNFDFGKC